VLQPPTVGGATFAKGSVTVVVPVVTDGEMVPECEPETAPPTLIEVEDEMFPDPVSERFPLT
jgi:hypothetical protein